MGSNGFIGRTRRLAFAATLFAAAVVPSLAAHAQVEDRWTVAEAGGETAQQAGGASWVALKPGDTVAEGAAVRTGTDGRLVLARSSHKDTITASPSSQFTVPRAATEATDPTILQTLGTLLFKVEHTPGRRFEVKAPYLAAVVKGTIFTVTIGADENVVYLANGSVEVTDANTREVALLRPGQTARVPVAPGRPMTVIGALAPGTTQPVTVEAKADDGGAKITQTLGDVQLDIAAVSNNLVRPIANTAATASTTNGSTASTEGSQSATTTVANTASAAGSTVSAAGTAASGAVGGAVGAVDGTVSTAGGAVSTAVASTTSTVGNTIGSVGGTVGATVAGAGSTVGSTLSSVGNAVGGSLGSTVSNVGATVGNTVSTVGNTVGSATTALGTTVAAAGNTTSNTLNSVTGAVTNLLGGAKNKLKLP